MVDRTELNLSFGSKKKAGRPPWCVRLRNGKENNRIVFCVYRNAEINYVYREDRPRLNDPKTTNRRHVLFLPLLVLPLLVLNVQKTPFIDCFRQIVQVGFKKNLRPHFGFFRMPRANAVAFEDCQSSFQQKRTLFKRKLNPRSFRIRPRRRSRFG